MNLRSCVRESELSDSLKTGHWPDACDASLRAHVNTCQRCADYLLLTQAFKSSRAAAVVHSNIDHPGLLYWRAQLRRRNQALDQLSRPTYFVASFAFYSALLVAFGFLFAQRRYAAGWLDWIRALQRSRSFSIEALWSPTSNWSVILLFTCLAAVVFFIAVALFLSVGREVNGSTLALAARHYRDPGLCGEFRLTTAC